MEAETGVCQPEAGKGPGERKADGFRTDVVFPGPAGKEPVFLCRIRKSCPYINFQIGKCPVRQDGIAVAAVLAPGDVDIAGTHADIAAVQAAELADADAGRIQERDLCPVLRIFKGSDDGKNLVPGRDSREMLIEAQERDFPPVPVPVEDVIVKIPELCDMYVYSP